MSSKTKEKHHAFAWCSSLVSGGYLSFPLNSAMVALRCAWKRCLALPCSLDVRLPASRTAGGRLHPISSQAIPCGYLDGLLARRDRKTLETQKTRRTAVRLAFVVSGGYLSFRAVSSQVLSAYKGLTSVFGMGTGGSP